MSARSRLVVRIAVWGLMACLVALMASILLPGMLRRREDPSGVSTISPTSLSDTVSRPQIEADDDPATRSLP